eukprot:COSAG02_NODE_22554_length_748_cov_1.244992_1_plen_77_part_00
MEEVKKKNASAKVTLALGSVALAQGVMPLGGGQERYVVLFLEVLRLVSLDRVGAWLCLLALDMCGGRLLCPAAGSP